MPIQVHTYIYAPTLLYTMVHSIEVYVVLCTIDDGGMNYRGAHGLGIRRTCWGSQEAPRMTLGFSKY